MTVTVAQSQASAVDDAFSPRASLSISLKVIVVLVLVLVVFQ